VAQSEVTLEANPPASATRWPALAQPGLTAYRSACSAGRCLAEGAGRLLPPVEAWMRSRIARTAFDRYSFDLILPRPDQNAQDGAEEFITRYRGSAEHLCA